MKKSLLIIFLAAHFTFAHGQIATRAGVEVKYPNNCKSIKQYKNSSLMQVQEFDKTKNIVFNNYSNSIRAVYQKPNGVTEQIITVKYDVPLGIVKPTQLRISIEYLNYDSKGRLTDSYTKAKLFDGIDSSVFKCSSREELKRYPKVLEALSTANVESKTIMCYDQKGNLECELSLNSRGDTSMQKNYQYNENNQKIKATTQLLSKLFNVETYEYANKLLAKIDTKSYNNKVSSTTNIYDANGLLKEVRYFSNEQLLRSTKNEYSNSGRIKESFSFSGTSEIPHSKCSYFFDAQSNLNKDVYEAPDIRIISYYNSNELIVKEEETDVLTNKTRTNNYTYEFGYF
jgi:hypothetical protein